MGYIGAARKHYDVLPVGPLIADEPLPTERRRHLPGDVDHRRDPAPPPAPACRQSPGPAAALT